MSSWKDSSDFASLAAALYKAKNLTKSPVNELKEIKESEIVKEEPKSSVEPEQTASTDFSAVSTNYTDFPDALNLPLKDSVTFKQHKSTVSALEFEASGSRFLSGSHDFTVAYWDFNGMVKDEPEPFRFIEPMGSYTVKSTRSFTFTYYFRFVL